MQVGIELSGTLYMGGFRVTASLLMLEHFMCLSPKVNCEKCLYPAVAWLFFSVESGIFGFLNNHTTNNYRTTKSIFCVCVKMKNNPGLTIFETGDLLWSTHRAIGLQFSLHWISLSFQGIWSLDNIPNVRDELCT